MTTAYQILGITEQASDSDIKQAYLQKVRENPPDRNPAFFEEIQTAYQAISTAKKRLAYALFTPPPADFEALLKQAFPKEQALCRLSHEHLLQLLSTGLDEKNLLNAITGQQQ